MSYCNLSTSLTIKPGLTMMLKLCFENTNNGVNLTSASLSTNGGSYQPATLVNPVSISNNGLNKVATIGDYDINLGFNPSNLSVLNGSVTSGNDTGNFTIPWMNTTVSKKSQRFR